MLKFYVKTETCPATNYIVKIKGMTLYILDGAVPYEYKYYTWVNIPKSKQTDVSVKLYT
jgi:hypothetical protein